MASPTAFGVAAAADAALPVPRRPRARGLGPGVYVSVRASVFSEAYAKDEFGASWRTSRVFGTIRHATGRHEWLVDFVDGTDFVCTSRQLREERQLPDGITGDVDAPPDGSSSDNDYELEVSDEEDLSACDD